MSKKQSYLFLLLGFVLINLDCFSSNFNSGDSVKTSKKEAFWKKGNIVPLPIIFYSPETELAFGAVLMNFFRLNKTDTISRTSNVRTALIYTTRNQFIASSDYNIFFKEEKYQLNGSLSFLSFPDNFYGIGNSTQLSDEEFYENNIFNFTARFTKNIGRGIFAGLQYNFYNMFNVSPSLGGELIKMNVPGSEGAALSGIGFIFTFDRRNNVLNATKGAYVELSNRFYASANQGYRFNEYRIDARKYFRLHKRGILAMQGDGYLNTGDVPIQKMAYLGGDKLLRGYYRGRYRDKASLIFQAEYRHSFCSRFGIAVFGGMGQVAPDVSNFAFSEMRHSWGGGLRFKLNKKENLNLRIDYGIGEDVSNFYLNLAEAF